MSSLLRELQYGIPEFGVLIPPGFERIALTDDAYETSRTMWREGLHDDATLERVLESMSSLYEAHEQLRAFGMVIPHRESEHPLPLNVTFSDLGVRPGRTISDELLTLREQSGAEFPDGDRRMLRWESVERTVVDGVRVAIRTSHHCIPVPDADGKKRLLISVSVTEAAGDFVVSDSDRASLWEVGDAIATSFTWLGHRPIELTDDLQC